MNEPVKAVARALRHRHDRRHRAEDEDIPECWMNDAHAAIDAFLAAVREPSEQVKAAGLGPRHFAGPITSWRIMIDALRDELLSSPGDGS